MRHALLDSDCDLSMQGGHMQLSVQFIWRKERSLPEAGMSLDPVSTAAAGQPFEQVSKLKWVYVTTSTSPVFKKKDEEVISKLFKLHV